MTDIAELGLRVNAQPVEAATKTLTNFKQVSESTEKSVTRNTNGMNAGFKNVSVGVNSVKTSATNAAPALKILETQTERAAKAGGGFAYKAKQMSMQLSQVASQGAVTGNYLQALAIQLPDLALSFGALGVLIGAAAGSLGVYLVNSLNAASKESQNTSDEIDSLAESFNKLTMAEKDAARVKVLTDLADRQTAIRKLSGEIGTAKFKFDANSRAQASGRITALEYAEAEKKILDNLSLLQGKLAESKREQDDRKQLLDDLTDGTRRNADEIKNVSDRLKDEYDQLTMNNAQLLERDLIRAKAKPNEIAEAKARLARIDGLKAEKEAQEDLNRLAAGIGNVQAQLDPNVAVINAAERRLAIIDAANAQDLNNQGKYDALRVANAQKLSDELVSIEERTKQQNSMILTAGQESALNSSSQLFGNLASIAQAGGEDQFQAYKNLASAQAAIAASLAVIKALAEGGPILGPILATSIGAVAAVQIAQIQGQEYQSSRASGGQAKGRVLVGENGPEVLNLGSQTGYVSPTTSLDKNGGGNNTTVFNVSAGVQGTVRSEILSLMPFFQQMAVQAAAQSAKNGGTMAKAVRLR